MTRPIDPIETALVVVRALDTLGIRNTVGGSIASSFAGEPRASIDIDVVAAIEDRHVAPLVAALDPDFYIDEDALRRAVLARSNANAIHRVTHLKVDLFIAGGTPLDHEQLARRLAVDLGDGRILHVHPPEDILLQKLRWLRRGGELSERQWRDISAIVRVQGERLDRPYLRAGAAVLDVSALLDRALGEQA